MDADIVYSASPSKSDEELEKGFVTVIIEQPKLLDELAKQLVTLGLAGRPRRLGAVVATCLQPLSGSAGGARSSSAYTRGQNPSALQGGLFRQERHLPETGSAVRLSGIAEGRGEPGPGHYRRHELH